MRATLLSLGLLLGATAAHAADACYRDSIGDISVFKKFKMPRPGDRKPLNGHTHNSLITLDGTVCGMSDGTRATDSGPFEQPDGLTAGDAHLGR